jgi:hypothetical protein
MTTDEERSSNEFIPALVKSLLKSCLANETDFDVILFKKRCHILDLNLFMNKSEKADTEILKSIQEFSHTIQGNNTQN